MKGRLLALAGIGEAILPVRFMVPPEIVLLDLVPSPADTALRAPARSPSKAAMTDALGEPS